MLSRLLHLPGIVRLRRFLAPWRLWFLAYFHLSDEAVCQLSVGRNLFDCYHDYHDSADGEPWHFTISTCERCGKEFTI